MEEKKSEVFFRQKKKAQLAYATYTVLRLISENYNQKQVSQKLKINKSNSSRRYSVLQKQQLIEVKYRSSIKVYSLTPSGRALMQHLRNIFGDATLNDEDFPLTFRWHHIIFKLSTLRKPIDFQQQLTNQKFYYGRKAGFIFGWIKRIYNADIVVTQKSILIYPKPIEAGSVNSAITAGCDLVDKIINYLKLAFPLLEVTSTTQICRQHCAMVGGITTFFNREYRYESDRIMIDCSTGVPELETIHKTYAIEDMQIFSSFFESLISNSKPEVV